MIRTVTAQAATYYLVPRIDAVEVAQDLTLAADTLAAPELVLNAARVTLTPRGSEGGAVDAGARPNLTNAGMGGTGYGPTTICLPAGEAKLLAWIGEASATETLSLSAGRTVDLPPGDDGAAVTQGAASAEVPFAV